MLDRLALVLLCFAGSVVAQQTTSPRGFVKKGGVTAFGLGMKSEFNRVVAFEIAQIDDTQGGRSQTIRAVHLRRSLCTQDNSTATARSLDFKMRMAHGDYSKVTGGLQTLDNLVVGKWSDVFPSGKVAFPDMTPRPATGPAPWALRIPLKAPFVFDGKSALYFQMTAWAASFRSDFAYELDAFSERFVWSCGSPIRASKSCKHKGKDVYVSADFRVETASQAPVQLFISSYPRITSQPSSTFAVIGGQSIDAKIPGVCTSLLALPQLVIPMGSTAHKANGETGYLAALIFPHAPRLIGLQLSVQTWAPDATQGPIALAGSRGWRTGSLPARPTPKTRVAIANIQSRTLGTLTTRAWFSTSEGVIVGLEK